MRLRGARAVAQAVRAARVACGDAAPRAGPRRRGARRPPRRAGFRFVDVAHEAGLTRVIFAGRPGKDHLLDSAGAGCAWLDYDRDGRLDVYLVNGWRLDGSTRRRARAATRSTATAATARSRT